MKHVDQLWLGAVSFVPTVALKNLLRLDSWKPRSAIFILMGLDESSLKTDCDLDSDGYPDYSTERWVSIQSLSGLAFTESISFDDEQNDVLRVVCLFDQLEAIWNSGTHPNENPPEYYVSWALGKGYTIPWLDWACDYGFFSPSLKTLPEKPMSVSDNTLLSTIGALLASWPGGKTPSGKDLERAAASVGIEISDDSIRKALNAARELSPSLKKRA